MTEEIKSLSLDDIFGKVDPDDPFDQSGSTDLELYETEDNVDDIFFSKHGVGDIPIDPELEKIGTFLDPMIATPQESAFCRYIIKGDNKTTAYKKAFGYDGTEFDPKTYYRNAIRLLERPRVAKKMFEIRQKIAEYEDEDIHTLISELNEDRKLARDLGQPGAAITAVKTKAQLLGLDNQEKTTNNITVNLSDNQRAQLLGRLGLKTDVIDADYKDIT